MNKMDVNRDFELNVGNYFREQGYEVNVTRATGDWGVDVFIQKDGKKGAVQVKNYGNCQTRISRKDIMELYGAMAFFDCDFAVFVYNGKMNDDAKQVADKLNIKCIYREQKLELELPADSLDLKIESFDECWEHYVMPLAGSDIESITKATYKIREIKGDKIVFINTKGKTNKVKRDDLKWVYNRIVNAGVVYGKQIRDELHTHNSSFIVAVYNHIPYFEIIKGPYIRLKAQK